MTNERTNNGELLKMTGICKSFSGVSVLKDVQFDLRAGEVHVLAGENGAGKSTLIKILAGVHTEYEGEIFLNSRPVQFSSIHEAAAAGISVIHQELSLVPSMTVADNIFLGREQCRGLWLKKREMTAHAEKLLAEIGLDIDVTRKLGSYPLSIQQMVEICKALVFDCRIIVMDEPTSALTDVEVEKLFAITDKLKKTGCGIIYISHKMEEIYRIADRITVLRDGRHIATASARELDHNKLVTWMVGRELNQLFPRHKSLPGPVRLKVRSFTLADPSGKPMPAVNDVSFSIRRGEILGIAGLQGAGNSELLNGIFGTYGCDQRYSIELDGHPYQPTTPANAIRQGISLLTNDRKVNGVILGMNVVHNITLAALKKYSPFGWLRPSGENKAAEKQREILNLKAASLNIPVDSLSGGNQQKVVMAKWIETEPKVFLLDEPTRGVDVGAKHEIYELMNKWTEEGISIILITSEMPELLAMSDRIIVMHRGRITAEFDSGQATQEKILHAAMGLQSN